MPRIPSDRWLAIQVTGTAFMYPFIVDRNV